MDKRNTYINDWHPEYWVILKKLKSGAPLEKHELEAKYIYELEALFKKYGKKNIDLLFKKYRELKKKTDIGDRWFETYTMMVDYCIELKLYERALKEWNVLMEELHEWEVGFGLHKAERFSFRFGDGEQGKFWTYYLLNFEYLLKRPVVTGRHVMGFGGYIELTPFGLEKVKEIEKCIDLLLKEYKSFFSLIWWDYDYEVYYTDSKTLKRTVGHTRRQWQDKCTKVATELGRTAENYFRKSIGIPVIGEGWVSETHLYYQIKNSLSTKVIHHGRPKWLGRQHFDIWIPKLNVAIEYQGSQHDKPVEFFGGEKAFKENQKRDKRKRELCKENGVKLIEVRKGYDIKEVIKQISQ